MQIHQRRNIFRHKDYRACLREMLEGEGGVKISYQDLAIHCRIQKSHVSKVLHGHTSFSEDQIYLIGQFLKLSGAEIEYLTLLVQADRCGVHDRKVALRERAEAMRAKALQTESSLPGLENPTVASDEALRAYFLDPYLQIVHLSLLIPKYQTDLPALAAALGLSAARVSEIADRLLRLGFATAGSGSIVASSPSLHLRKDSEVYDAHRNLVRSLSATRLSQLSKSEGYAFAVSFVTSDEALEKIRLRFLDFIKAVKEESEGAEEQVCAQLNFDLFTWS